MTCTEHEYTYETYEEPTQLRAPDLLEEAEEALAAGDGKGKDKYGYPITAGPWTRVDDEGRLAATSGEWLKVGDRLGIEEGADAIWGSVWEGEGPGHGFDMYLNDPELWEQRN